LGDNIFEIAITAILSIGGWFVKHMHGKIEKNQEDLAAYKTHVAENYANKNNLEAVMDEVQYVRGAVDDIKRILINKVQ